jgi:hypothetical protein
MSLNKVPSGKNLPDDFNVIIEIPMHGEPVKYEVDKESGAIFVDRFMNTAMHYPCNYGYIPHTLSDDGDPVDVLVITPVPLNTDGRRIRNGRQGAGRAGGQALHAVSRTEKSYRTAAHRTPANLAFLPALQGPRTQQVGQDRRMGRYRGSSQRDHVRGRKLPERARKTPVLITQ